MDAETIAKRPWPLHCRSKSAGDRDKLANKRAEPILNATILAAQNAVASGAETGLTAGLSIFLEAAESIAGKLERQFLRTRRLLYGLLSAIALLALGATALAVLFAAHR